MTLWNIEFFSSILNNTTNSKSLHNRKSYLISSGFPEAMGIQVGIQTLIVFVEDEFTVKVM